MIKSSLIKIIIKGLCPLIIILNFSESFSQGRKFTWLLGHHYSSSSAEGRVDFTLNSYSILQEQRDIPFRAAEGNISDENGNILFSCNGYFVADAVGDTMLNGTGINPGQFTTDYGDQGLPLPYSNFILPMPNDSNKFVLFHQTANYNSPTLASTEIYYSVIDISLNGGLGSVVSKNNVIVTGSFGWGMTACKHGNGRDWWIVALSDSGTTAFNLLLTPDTVQYIGYQNLQVPAFPVWGGQPTFSPDGNMFAYSHTESLGTGFYPLNVRLFDFDRCTGVFINRMYINMLDSTGGFGISFSPNSKYLYASSTQRIYQFDTDSVNVANTKTVVAINDTFLSAPPVFYTNFNLMYLAANGKIYLTSTNGVLHLHEMDYPDSSGLACNINLHNILLPCFNVHTVPNHPNYYLGRKIGSTCDTLTNINDLTQHDFHFSISPNPSSGNFKIIYLLPQNKSGTIQILDITGKEVFKQNLPQWSTLQNISIPNLSNGVYAIKINADNFSVTKKLLVQQE